MAGTAHQQSRAAWVLHVLEEAVLPRSRTASQLPTAAALVEALESELAERPAGPRNGEAAGILALLQLVGLPDSHGRLLPPEGLGRNISKALAVIAEGLEVGSCGLCHSILGLLLSLGHPEALARTKAWLKLGPPLEAPLVCKLLLFVVVCNS
ncbi:unnamed protein product [Polarella glacialis]|uniref:Uncharacterized protein n=1 Tax=Polarella glacialis TaxID=89957 RepID=A0A813GCV5_POLGL|nr:unnamed protein product [Polarella glacialis]